MYKSTYTVPNNFTSDIKQRDVSEKFANAYHLEHTSKYALRSQMTNIGVYVGKESVIKVGPCIDERSWIRYLTLPGTKNKK